MYMFASVVGWIDAQKCKEKEKEKEAHNRTAEEQVQEEASYSRAEEAQCNIVNQTSRASAAA